TLIFSLFPYTTLFRALVVSLILSIFFVRMPKSKEELESNIPRKKKSNEDSTHHVSWGYTISEVTKIPQFWMIGISFIFVGFYVAGIALQFIAYLQNL